MGGLMGFLFILGWLLLGLLGVFIAYKIKSEKGFLEVDGEFVIVSLFLIIMGPLGLVPLLIGFLQNSDKVFFTIGKKDD